MRSFDGLSRPRPKKTRGTGPRIIDAPAPRRKRGNAAGGFFALVIMASVVIFGFGSLNAVSDSNNKVENQESTPTNSVISELELPQGGLSNDQSLEDLLIIETPGLDSSEQPDTTESTNAATEPTTRILNGGATSGSATELETSLKTRGYEVLSVSNANNPHPTTTLYYQAGFKEQAEQLATDFNLGEVEYIEDSIADPANVLIVLGQNY